MKVTWPGKEAAKIIKRHRGASVPVVFETGYGPSGLPHIGTFAEVARTCFVLESLRDQAPELETELIVFSDDMDGLRSVPRNLPRQEMLAENLGRPLTCIPDPFGEADSFAGGMNQQLCRFLDSFGFSYAFRSSTESYRSGVFDEGLVRIMEHYDEIRDVFTATIGEEKRARWSPYFVVCEQCGKIYSTTVTGLDREQGTIRYRCDHDVGDVASCGHESEVEVTGGRCKVGWKIDWALRWYTLGVDYEMHGKDLIDSVTVSGKVCRILGKPPPLTYKYELFHDEEGRKISKKLGNGITMEQWVDYAPLGALIHFLLGNPNKPTKMGLPILPKLTDEYLSSMRSEADGEGKNTSVSWFLEKFPIDRERLMPKAHTAVSYSLLANVAENLAIQDPDLLFRYGEQYDAGVNDDEAFFLGLCRNVLAYVEEYARGLPKPELEINLDWVPLLSEVAEALEEAATGDDKVDGDVMQTALFSLAKERDLDVRGWFQFLYAAILQKRHGPKLGPFFQAVGKAKALELIQQAAGRHAASG